MFGKRKKPTAEERARSAKAIERLAKLKEEGGIPTGGDPEKDMTLEQRIAFRKENAAKKAAAEAAKEGQNKPPAIQSNGAAPAAKAPERIGYSFNHAAGKAVGKIKMDAGTEYELTDTAPYFEDKAKDGKATMIKLGDEFFVANGRNENAVGSKLEAGDELVAQKISAGTAAKIQATLEM